MREDIVRNLYFYWMCDLINSRCDGPTYWQLLYLLDNTDFVYSIPMDGNRADDGIDLRYQFGNERNIDQNEVALYLDNHPCSVLEMLVALSRRIETQIMTNPEFGDRTSQWFWAMINNLGLGHMTDANFEKILADDILKNFLNRDYKPNGEGGLFTLTCCRRDLRSVDIWYQAMWYLTEEYNT